MVIDKKIGKIMYVGVDNKYYSSYQSFYLVLEKIAKDFICFDFRMNNLYYGKERMNEMFLETIEKENPDFIFFSYFPDEFKIETIMKIKEISPNTNTIMFFGDDDVLYDCYSRYYQLLFDYCLIGHKQFEYRYKEDGMNNTFTSADPFILTIGTNLDVFKPLNIEKKYDVVFIGNPDFDRYEYLKFLIDKGVNVKIFGRGWHKHPEMENYYGGPLTHIELVQTINESKIVINFTKNMFDLPSFKGRVTETAACNSFMLVEYFSEYAKMLKQGKEIVMFKDKDELLKKIYYYLEHDKEREEIAKKAYNFVKKRMDFEKDLRFFFNKISKKKIVHRELPRSNKKMLELITIDINLPIEELKKKVDSYDYISFNENIVKKHQYKEFFQVYSLEKSNKPISCCNCYIGNNKIQDYLYYTSFYTFYKNKEDFFNTVTIDQIAVTKAFFLENLENIKDIFNKKIKKIDFFTWDNTSFIEIPLVTIPKIRYLKYDVMKTYLSPKFFYKLYSLKHQKKLWNDPYAYRLALEMIKGNFFILYLLKGAMFDKHYKTKIEELEE